jgi:hypothetical protein
MFARKEFMLMRRLGTRGLNYLKLTRRNSATSYCFKMFQVLTWNIVCIIIRPFWYKSANGLLFWGVVTFLLHPTFKHSLAYWLRFVGHPQIYSIDCFDSHVSRDHHTEVAKAPGSLPAAVFAWGCSTAVERNVPRAEIEGQLYKTLPV